jgi:photosystem II stability/assembly factor-like uncharacterized protein
MKKTLLLLHLFVAILSENALSQNWKITVLDSLLPSTYIIQAMSAPASGCVWAIASKYYSSNVATNAQPIVVKTTDGGKTWVKKIVVPAKGTITYDIAALDANTALITSNQLKAGGSYFVFKTTDGGNTWRKILPPKTCGGGFIHFFNKKDGVIINNFDVATSNNGGETWNQLSLFPPVMALGEYCSWNSASNVVGSAGNSVWFGTNKGRIFYSNDKGENWNVSQAGSTSDVIMSIAFTDEKNGIAVAPFSASGTQYKPCKYFKTSNGGQTWSKFTTPYFNTATSIAAVPNAAGYYFATDFTDQDPDGKPAICAKYDGSSWTETLSNCEMSFIEFFSPSEGYIAGVDLSKNNAIWTWTGAAVTPTEELKNSTNINIFPNPATDNLQIDLSGLNTDDEVKSLLIQDNLGRIIQKIEIVGTSIYQLELSNYLKGVYFLTVKSNTTQQTFKFIKVN